MGTLCATLCPWPSAYQIKLSKLIVQLGYLFLWGDGNPPYLGEKESIFRQKSSLGSITENDTI